MYLDKFVHSYTGRIIMSILLGLGLATFFRAVCKGKRCNIISAPPLEEIDDGIFKMNGKCYKYEKNPIDCNKSKRTVKIA
jgi:hypothetical protein